MIQKINFTSAETNNNSKQKNIAVPAAATTLGLGAAGGYATFKVKGFDKDASKDIKTIKDMSNNDIQIFTDAFEQETYTNSIKNTKYSKFLNDVILEQDKEFKKDFELADFLDKEDLNKFNNELSSGKQKIQEFAEESILVLKKELSKIRWKYLGIGASIGAGLGLLILAINAFKSKSSNKGK